MLLENKTYSFINKQLVGYRGKFPSVRYFNVLKNETRNSVGKLLSCCTEQLIAHYFTAAKQKLYFRSKANRTGVQQLFFI